MPLSARHRLPALLLAAGALLCVAAPDELESAKKAYEAEQDAALKDLRTFYHSRLAPLEKQLAAQGKFSEAAKVQAERQAVAQKIGAAEIYTASRTAEIDRSTGILTLTPGMATMEGGVTLDDSGALSGWTTDKARARWALPAGIRGGAYRVRLNLSCAGDGGGKVVFREGKYTLQRDVTPPSSADVFAEQDFSPLRVRGNGTVEFEISAQSVKGSGLFRLKSVLLLPPGAEVKSEPVENPFKNGGSSEDDSTEENNQAPDK